MLPFNLIRSLLAPFIILLSGICLAHTQESIAYINQIEGIDNLSPLINIVESLIGGGDSVRSVVSDGLIISGLIYILFEAAWFAFEMAMACLTGLFSSVCLGSYMLFKLSRKAFLNFKIAKE